MLLCCCTPTPAELAAVAPIGEEQRPRPRDHPTQGGSTPVRCSAVNTSTSTHKTKSTCVINHMCTTSSLMCAVEMKALLRPGPGLPTTDRPAAAELTPTRAPSAAPNAPQADEELRLAPRTPLTCSPLTGALLGRSPTRTRRSSCTSARISRQSAGIPRSNCALEPHTKMSDRPGPPNSDGTCNPGSRNPAA